MKRLSIHKTITNKDSDSIYLYFGEVSKLKVLTNEQEVELADKVKNGDEKAKNKLIESNLRFVISVAKQYQKQGVPLDDLIGEGNYGLIKAAQKFDNSRGFKFISYAIWWIRQSILQAIADNSRIIRMPINKINYIYKIKKATTQLRQSLEREPTDDEIVEIMRTNKIKIENGFPRADTFMSIDSPISDEEDSDDYHDIIPSQDFKIEDRINEVALKKELNMILKRLNNRQNRIVCMYFGLMGYQQMTLEEISLYLGLTRERVRQIKDSAIKLLRTKNNSCVLKQYF